MHVAITGAAGFIGSHMVKLALAKNWQLSLVDIFSRDSQKHHWENLPASVKIHRDLFPELLESGEIVPDFIIHLGARTNTLERDFGLLRRLNTDYTRRIWESCTEKQIPLIYASSAATYGDGAYGYSDSHEMVSSLKPLNAYARSKQEMDLFALGQEQTPPFWAGLKFFNVFGPGEGHKGRMASVVWHARNQIRESGTVRLFRSHRPDFSDGKQERDFVYVNDVVRIIQWMMEKRPASGLYNVGTGQARTFLDLAQAVIRESGREAKIKFEDMPMELRDKYQYSTCADMSKLRGAGYTEAFTSLEEGVAEYLREEPV